MLNSVRFRLTFYYTAAFAIVLLVLALGLYAILQRETVQRIDADISNSTWIPRVSRAKAMLSGIRKTC